MLRQLGPGPPLDGDLFNVVREYRKLAGQQEVPIPQRFDELEYRDEKTHPTAPV